VNEENPLYWIGERETEIDNTGTLFCGSITVYGSNKNTNYAFDKSCGYRIDHNEDNPDWINFVNQAAEIIIKECSECRFMLYYPPDLPLYSQTVQCRVIDVNDMNIIALLENKIQTRLWMEGLVPLPPFSIMEGSQISYGSLYEQFPSYSEFVVQADSSCAGNGTWLLTSETEPEVLEKICSVNSYTVTPYLKNNIPINIHLIIFQKEVVNLPPSVQLISAAATGFAYKGADFIAYQQLSDELKQSIIKYALRIGKRLQSTGYLGVCGIDFIATSQEIYFMEINSRFQSSTMVINFAFVKNGVHNSVQLLHHYAFNKASCPFQISKLEVNCSFYIYSNQKSNRNRLEYLRRMAITNPKFVQCIDDNIDLSMEIASNAYLYLLFFTCNIAAVSPEHTCIINSNIAMNDEIFNVVDEWKTHLTELKVMLLNHGIRISQDAQQYVQENGGLNHKEFEAIDLCLQGIFIKVPFETKSSQLSPFEIDLNQSKQYILTYWGEFISIVDLRTLDPLGRKKLLSGFRYDEIAYLGIDRLRVYYRSSCYYKQMDLGCHFCDIDNSYRQFNFEDIKTVLNEYADHPRVRHYLVGGGSDGPDSNYKHILQIVNYINKTTGKPIYLMITPPRNTKILEHFFQAGVTEISFNMELFDRKLAKQYMPGKGDITLDAYYDAFLNAVKLWGRNGNVRSVFIVGLEAKESIIQGIEFVSKLGVSPILSLFKPIEGTPLENLLPPPDWEILEILRRTEEICHAYGVELGPACHYCEDNTLKISLQ